MIKREMLRETVGAIGVRGTLEEGMVEEMVGGMVQEVAGEMLHGTVEERRMPRNPSI